MIKALERTITETGTQCSVSFLNKNDGPPTDDVCADTEEIRDIANNLVIIANIDNPKLVINRPSSDTSREEIIETINKATVGVCDTDDLVCASEQVSSLIPNVYKKIKSNYRPPHPSHDLGWLSSLDISRTMKSITRLYDDFVFLGPIASDWDSPNYINDVGEYNIVYEYKSKGLCRIGIIINLDVHTGPGTHWVGLFMAIPKKNSGQGGVIFYYNSFGKSPPDAIKRYVNRAGKAIKSITGHNTHFFIHSKKHQMENRECGMYSLNFIFTLLDATTGHMGKLVTAVREAMPKLVSDASMDNKRNVVFF